MIRFAIVGPGLALLGGLGAWSLAARAAAEPVSVSTLRGEGSQTIAIRAGTMHLVEGGMVLTGGATLLVKDGRILAAGTDLEIPAGARTVDYGPDSVLIPGLVSVNCNYVVGPPSERTADVSLLAIDGFSFESLAPLRELAGGVTSMYLPPARARLLAGQGAVVKLAGASADARTLARSAALQGSIGPEVRDVPGFWEPPIPATSEVGLGFAEPQLPRTTMGALVALAELVRAAKSGAGDERYGEHAPRELAELLQRRTPWRMGANSPAEIRALLEFARSESLPLIIEGGAMSGELAGDIAAAGAAVILVMDYPPQTPRPVGQVQRMTVVDGQLVEEDAEAVGTGRELGRGEDDFWPTYEGAAELSQAGVRLAIATPNHAPPRDLRFAAALACRGGLESQAALRAITLGAAEVLGVADRVGSLRPGKDADFVVLSGDPISSAGVVATWIDGEPVFEGWEKAAADNSSGHSKGLGSRSARSAGRPRPTPVVFEVDELHVGDGRVLRPGQLVVRDGRIAEVAERVAHPAGAPVVRGRALMPGMVDSLGHLGMEGSSKVPSADFRWTRTIEPGDRVDRRVAKFGVTTVVLGSPGTSNSGTPLVAYKPASTDLDRMVLADPTALRMAWSNRNRFESGVKVKEVLAKAGEYAKKWKDYEAALAKWNATPQPAAQAKPEEKAKEESKDKPAEKPADKPAGASEEKAGDKDKKEGAADKKDADKDKKDKKKGDDKAKEEADPVSGIWEGELQEAVEGQSKAVRLQLELAAGKVSGSLRCNALSKELVLVAGVFADKRLDVAGLSRRGWIHVDGSPTQGKLEGKLKLGGQEHAFKAERKQTEIPKAKRSELRKTAESKLAEPKGKPQPPGFDPKLEPLRQAMLGKAAVLVDVDRRDEVLEAVEAFSKAGIRPVLTGDSEVALVIESIKDRIAGVLLTRQVFQFDPSKGLVGERNLHTELTDAGVPVAFPSDAEEGAADLWVMAAYSVSKGMSPTDALRAVTSDAARLMGLPPRVGLLQEGYDGDVLLLDGPPLEPATRILRTWVDGVEVR